MTKYIILIISILSIALADTSITGQVFDEKGNPLSYAIITNESNQDWVIADENGWFRINSQVSINDTLKVSRYGYRNGQLIITSKPFYIINLIPQPINRNTVEVIGYNRIFADNITNTYSKQLDDGNRQTIFNQIPGLLIRSYGGNAGIMTVSTLGSATVNTKILFDDIELTSAQNGETDISQIPQGMMDNITSNSSPSILFGSGASNAVININHLNDKSYISAKMGSYDYKSINSQLSKSWEKWTLRFSVGYLTDDGDYFYNSDSSSVERENNEFEQKYINISSKGMITKRSTLKISYLESHQNRGVAGATNWLTPEANKDDKLQLAALQYNFLHENGYTKLLINHRKSFELFTDPLSWYTKRSEHTVNGTNLRINHLQNFGIIKAHFLGESKIESIESFDVGDHTRNTNSIATEISFPIYNKLKVKPSLRYDFGEKITSNISKALSALFDMTDNIQFEYQFSTGLRYPTFNDMYWNPGGNPDLKPELSQNHSLKFGWKLNGTDILFLQINDRFVEDLIKWKSGEGYWYPDNISESRHSSITFGLNTTLSNSPLQFSVNGTFQKAVDIELDEPLLNIPQFVFSTGITYSTPRMNIFFSEHLRHKTQYKYNFDEDNFLPDYFIFNIAVEYIPSILDNHISTLIAIENIFNKFNESISGYPEPGRTFKIGLTYTL